jgi:hypothetical protein
MAGNLFKPGYLIENKDACKLIAKECGNLVPNS